MRERVRTFVLGAAAGALAAVAGWALAGSGGSPDGGLSWKSAGKDLSLTATAEGRAYLVVGAGKPATAGEMLSTEALHAATASSSFSADRHQLVAVYEIVPVMELQYVDLSWGIRPCQPCILPPPPPPPTPWRGDSPAEQGASEAGAADVEWWLMAAQ